MLSQEFLTVNELANHLMIKVKTLYLWAESGKIPAYKVNGILRFDKKEIDKFLELSKNKPKNPAREAKKILGKHLVLGHNSFDNGQEASSEGRS